MEDFFEQLKDDTHQARQSAKTTLFYYIQGTINWNKPTPMHFDNVKTGKRELLNITTEMLKDIIEGTRNEDSGVFLTAYINFYNMECKRLNVNVKDDGLNILNYFYNDLNEILKEFKPRIKALKIKKTRKKQLV